MIQAIDDVNLHNVGEIEHQHDKSLLQSAGKLVSPDDVKLAIAKETSLENLRQFSLLLAEDNFDLAAEVRFDISIITPWFLQRGPIFRSKNYS